MPFLLPATLVVPVENEQFEMTLFFFQAEDGIRDSVASRGLGDVYKRQRLDYQHHF